MRSDFFAASFFSAPRIVACRLLFSLFALAIICSAPQARAEEDNDVLISPEQLADDIGKALASYTRELEQLKSRRRELGTLQEKVLAEIDSFESLNTAHKQLMLEVQPRIENLENAIKNNRISFRVLEERAETLEKLLESVSIISRQTDDRIEMVGKQIDEVRGSRFSDAQKKLLEDANQEVMEVLEEKKRLCDQALSIYVDLLDSVKALMEAKNAVVEKLAARLESLRRSSLLKRFDPYSDFTIEAFLEDYRSSTARLRSIFSPTTWDVLWARAKLGGLDDWAFFFGVLGLIAAFQGRCRRMLLRIEERCEGPNYHYRRLALYLIRHSLAFLCLTLVFGIYSSLRFSLLNIGMERVLFLIFFVLTTTRWGLDYIKHWAGGPPTALRSFVATQFSLFFRFFRAVFIVAIILIWITGTDTLLSWIVKSVLSAVFLCWAIVFWQGEKRISGRMAKESRIGPQPKWVDLLRWWTFLVVGGAMFLNFLGYRILGGRWFISWTNTVVVLFWWWIGLNAIREWGHDLRTETGPETDRPQTSAYHLRCSLFQFSRVAWVLIVAAGIVRSWDPTGIIGERIGYFFGLTLSLGSLKLSIKGVLSALVIFYATLMGVRIGRTLLKEKVLDGQSFERGLQDSILTIASYLGWALGLLLALGTLGFDTTSLAVVFGALSIGIGFGLQNIFNNFISGLILLFERPIQVGDYVEIEGLWAEVKKINVRATVVQTFDNASVIIPNSDFISKQVTNWSFKDKRMRRNIEVGVAYGSDIELVMATMLEIAKEIPEVLKYPKPDVIFIDHADSALIFRLRIWVYVDNFWSVPSRIRCEIDRRFRELDIEIAFPQRDLHIRSLPKELFNADSTAKKFDAPPGEAETEKAEQ